MQQTIQINASPHQGQREVHRSGVRFKVLAAGRRWGKTRLGVNECLDVASKGGRAWWVAPSYKMSEVGWRPLQRLGAQIGADVRRVDRRVTLPGGGWVQVRSADNPDSLRGEGLDYVVMDECAFAQERAWTEALRPALADRQGSALFISTPKGRDWFWRLWVRGQTGEEPDWKSWQKPTSANPFIDPGEIEEARQSLPERIFEQEFLAEFLEDHGAVFRRVKEAATARVREREDGHEYVFGIDWGKHLDFTVAIVIDATINEMVEMDRFRQIDYQLQVGRLRQLYERYMPGTIIAESNAMGEPLIEQLQIQDMPVTGFTTTNATKKIAVEGLSLAIERKDLLILPEPELINELLAFEPTRLPSGMLRYAAPEGMHDDCVIALALAWHGVTTSAGPWALLI